MSIIIIIKCVCGLILCYQRFLRRMNGNAGIGSEAFITFESCQDGWKMRALANDKFVRHPECTQMTCKILFRRIFYQNPFQFDTIYIPDIEKIVFFFPLLRLATVITPITVQVEVIFTLPCVFVM